MPVKECTICHVSINVPNGRTSIRSHMLEQHPDVQLRNDARNGTHPKFSVAFRCVHCDTPFVDVAVYTAHLARDHPGKTSFPPSHPALDRGLRIV